MKACHLFIELRQARFRVPGAPLMRQAPLQLVRVLCYYPYSTYPYSTYPLPLLYPYPTLQLVRVLCYSATPSPDTPRRLAWRWCAVRGGSLP